MGRVAILLFWGLWLLLAGCREEKERPLLIPEDKLVEVLVDVHLAESALQNRFGPAKDSLAERYYEKIFELHDVERADFEETMERVRRDPETSERIYETVLEKLSAMEAEVQ